MLVAPTPFWRFLAIGTSLDFGYMLWGKARVWRPLFICTAKITQHSYKLVFRQGVAPLNILRNKNAKDVLFVRGLMATG
jgi:hypothetical protein